MDVHTQRKNGPVPWQKNECIIWKWVKTQLWVFTLHTHTQFMQKCLYFFFLVKFSICKPKAQKSLISKVSHTCTCVWDAQGFELSMLKRPHKWLHVNLLPLFCFGPTSLTINLVLHTDLSVFPLSKRNFPLPDHVYSWEWVICLLYSEHTLNTTEIVSHRRAPNFHGAY